MRIRRGPHGHERVTGNDPPMSAYIPLLIFLARVCDVSIGTLRSIIVMSGHKVLAALLGFVEIVVWVYAVGAALKHLTEPLAIIAYASGFATGVLLGMWIEERLALGYRVIRIISPRSETEVTERLRERGYMMTRVDGQGPSGPVEICFLVLRRRALPPLLRHIREIMPSAYVTVERVETPHANGVPRESSFRLAPWRRMLPLRK